MGPRRALVLASGSRYAMLVMQVVTTFIVARQLQPAQFGVVVLGASVFLIAEALRELGSVAYLVQQKDLTQAQIRSAFTISLIVTVLVTACMLAAADTIATFYRQPMLADYLRISAIGYGFGPFVHPISAVMTRNMAFHRIAAIDVGSTFINALLAISLVGAGWGVTGMAWANVGSGLIGALLGFWFQRDLSIFRPSLAEWRSVLSFGLHGSATAMTYRLSEALLFLILGRSLDSRAIGLLQRAYLLAQIPERVLLAGAGAVAMPTFAKQAREGGPLAPLYLRSLELMSGVHFAAMLGLILLAKPLVAVLLGPGWSDAAVLIQIMATGLIFGSAATLNTLMLIAAGGIRQTTPLALIQMATLIVATALAAPHGVEAVALTALVTAPISGLVSLAFLRHRVPMPGKALAASLWRSVIAGAAAASGALVIALSTDWPDHHPVLALATSVGLGALLWLAALALTRHPLWAELTSAARRLQRTLRPA